LISWFATGWEGLTGELSAESGETMGSRSMSSEGWVSGCCGDGTTAGVATSSGATCGGAD
jgi:hypothetical protein